MNIQPKKVAPAVGSASSDALVPDRFANHVPETADGLLDRADRFSRRVARAFPEPRNPLQAVVDGMISAVEATVDGKQTLLFGTNSYLGLNFHPDCKAAAIAAVEQFGTGSTASRAAGGTAQGHVDLERELAAFFGRRYAIVYSTGFMANLGVIGALTRPGDLILLDAHCHASMIDAARLSGAQLRFFRHNDAADLDRQLRGSDIPAAQTLVGVEGLYGVSGDLALLSDVLTVAKDHGAVTLVDEAHSFGVYGAHGRGAAEQAGVEALVDIVVGTLSKSAGVIGGFSVTQHDELRDLRIKARAYLYTASLPPAVIASARQALRLMADEPSLRDQLWRNASQLRDGLASRGVSLSGKGPVGRIRMSVTDGKAAWQALLDHGIYVNLLVPPATPDGDAALRLSLSAAHTPAHIETAIDMVSAVIRPCEQR